MESINIYYASHKTLILCNLQDMKHSLQHPEIYEPDKNVPSST